MFVWMLVVGMAVAGTETLTTRDGVAIVADIYPKRDAPGVVLMHMIPPHHERSSWPADFIAGLGERGYAVCVPDRRGAGQSGGKAKEAYVGPKGKYDVEVCVKRLQKDGLTRLAIIGASNGTTSMIDYAVWAPKEGLPVPVGLGFMTGGKYTESQTRMLDLLGIAAAFTYSTEERAWSVGYEGKSRSWWHHEFDGGAHGTKMFGVKPEVSKALYDFLKIQLGPQVDRP